jgi:hypothetical protein
MCQNQQTYTLSSKKNKLVLPSKNIIAPKILYDELRYHIRTLFDSNSDHITFFDNIIISYLDIQNYLLIQYLETEKQDYLYEENDIVLLCGVILYNKIPSKNNYWLPFDTSVQLDISRQKPLDQIITYVITKSIL